jgi:hypothetical protein
LVGLAWPFSTQAATKLRPLLMPSARLTERELRKTPGLIRPKPVLKRSLNPHSFGNRSLESKSAGISLARQKGMIVHEDPFRNNDLMIAAISGSFAWMITLALRTAFGN